MRIYGYAATGFVGRLVLVEVDIRRGIPGLDIVGLPDGAVRESRDRVRVALGRSGFTFPRDRILVNLAPADLRKQGASYDLPIAVGILLASGQLKDSTEEDLLCLGELMLDGGLRAVSGVLPAVATALAAGKKRFLVPQANGIEAQALKEGEVFVLKELRNLEEIFSSDSVQGSWGKACLNQGSNDDHAANKPLIPIQDLADLRGQPLVRRALELAASGRHHLLLFGPPGSGKTLAARSLPGLLPDLESHHSVEVTRIHSQAGFLGEQSGLYRRPPFREPHHSASPEGIIGGGKACRPGEISLAHRGILFLDEAPEFGMKVLQTLREPLESGRIDLVRAGRSWWFPANFQLQLAMNPCPCGNLGRDDAPCLCGTREVSRYWRRLGGALLDRVDIRVPVSPVSPQLLLEAPGEDSATVRTRVRQARDRQQHRYAAFPWDFNAEIPAGELNHFVALDQKTAGLFTSAARKLGLSSRAAHGVLRVSRTIADLAGHAEVSQDDLLESLQHRRYGDRDLYWTTL